MKSALWLLLVVLSYAASAYSQLVDPVEADTAGMQMPGHERMAEMQEEAFQRHLAAVSEAQAEAAEATGAVSRGTTIDKRWGRPSPGMHGKWPGLVWGYV